MRDPEQGTDQDALAARRTMAHWLVTVLRESRVDAGAMLSEVAGAARVDQSTISRLEAEPSLPSRVDRYVAAYAEVVGIDDPRELWQQAIDRWRREGAPPVASPGDERPSRKMARQIREVARRNAPAPDAKPETRNATRTKRASG